MSLLENTSKKKIADKAFTDLCRFYNEYAYLFIDFEKRFGINIWFLNHFKTYFLYRSYLAKEPSHDRDSVSSTWKTMRRLMLEFFYILRFYRSPKHLKGCVALFDSGVSNDIFEGLGVKYLKNRQLFNIKSQMSRLDFEHGREVTSDNIFLSYIFKCTFLYDIISFYISLKKKYSEIDSFLTSDSDFNQRIILGFIRNNIFLNLVMYLRYKSFDLYFKKSEIDKLLLSDENSPQQKVIQYAALKNGIKVFAFQHGNIHQLHLAYMYGGYDKKPLLPTITFTWGNYFTNLLIQKGGYRSNQVVTSGRLSSFREKRQVNSKIIEKKNYILYPSQPQRDQVLRYKYFKDLLSVVKLLEPKFSLIVRPHPREVNDCFFNEVANDVGFSNFVIDRETDLKSHFEICNILVVAFSTVGTEFVQYLKPILVLDYLNQDSMGWIKEGVGVAIHEKDDLTRELRKDKIEISVEKHKGFVNEYYINDIGVIGRVKNYLND